MDAHGPRHILHFVLAEEARGKVLTGSKVNLRCTGDGDAPGTPQGHYPRGQIHSVSVEALVLVLQYVADVNADSQGETLGVMLQRIRELPCGRHGEVRRAQDAGKLRHEAIAHSVDDAAFVLCRKVVRSLTEGPHSLERPLLVARGVARVADDVGTQDRREMPPGADLSQDCEPLSLRRMMRASFRRHTNSDTERRSDDTPSTTPGN